MWVKSEGEISLPHWSKTSSNVDILPDLNLLLCFSFQFFSHRCFIWCCYWLHRGYNHGYYGFSYIVNYVSFSTTKPMGRNGMDLNKKENVLYIIFLFRGEVPAASTEFPGQALPGVWRLWWEQAQLHSNLQWICELLDSLLLHNETYTQPVQ